MRRVSRVLPLALLATALPSLANAQASTGASSDTISREIKPLLVTVTRTPVTQFDAPQPVSVISAGRIADGLVNSIPDLFPNLAGLDLAGVGAQQVRPVIRGQKGQRILLLQDGMRLNNSRRQQDFGEIPSLIDPATIQRVEIVRGPSSVLYGTDAIGGVVNIITRTPQSDGLRGSVGYRFGELAGQHQGSARIDGRFGLWDVQLDASVRDAGDYMAPSGRFGNIELPEATTVEDTGVEDRRFSGRLGYRFREDERTWFGVERYDGNDGGFGVVPPVAYGDDGPEIRIRYPSQEFTKYTVGYEANDLGTAAADAVLVSAYRQTNQRTLSFLLNQAIGPGATLRVENENYSDLTSTGFRLEARKEARPGVQLTYGVDGFFDDSENSDHSESLVTGFGPPMFEESDRPQVPNADYRSIGVFGQAEFGVGDRISLVAGGRVQDLSAHTRTTPGLDGPLASRSERTAVGALNGLFRLTERVHLIGTAGTGFRSPNLVELFFEGPVPEGSGYQVPNEDLGAETSVNFDLGARFQSDDFAVEGFWFRNRIQDAIRISPTDDVIDGLPAFENVNVDRVVVRGVELTGEAYLPRGLSVEGGLAWLDSDESEDGTNPVGETYASKVSGAVRWRSPRAWAEYGVRYQGEREEAGLSENPIGDVLPAFTTHALRAGATVFDRGPVTHRITVALENLTDALYADFANAAFFRPAPGRNLVVQFDLIF